MALYHLAIDQILFDLKEKAVAGFECIDYEGVKRRCHPCIASYVCDIPEGKDVSSVKNGKRSLRNCHRCLTMTSNFNKYSCCPPRSGHVTLNTIETAIELYDKGKKNSSDKMLDEYSLTKQIPYLQSFPFVGTHPCLDFHKLFSYEPLHCFHLGISKELKKCLSERMRSEVMTTSAVPTKSGIFRTTTFRVIRTTVLNGINNMLVHLQTCSPMKGLRITFGTGAKGENGNGLYNDEGNLIGMLEGKDDRSLDMVSPFLASFVDRCGDETENAPTTTLFTQYVDIMLYSLSYTDCEKWTDEKITYLQELIKQFKSDTTSLYQNVQHSSFCLEKFHLLDHVTEDIRRLGGIKFTDASLFEYAHTLFKSAYRSGSKRRKMAMDETVLLFMKQLFSRDQGDEKKTTKEKMLLDLKRETAQQRAKVNACASVNSTGKKFRLQTLESVCRYSSKASIARTNGNIFEENRWNCLIKQSPQVIQDILSDVGLGGCAEMCTCLRTHFRGTDGADLGKDPRLLRVKSGFVCGWKTPTYSNYDQRSEKIRVQPCSIRRNQRVVCERDYYKNGLLRQDCILIEAEDNSRSPKSTLWVAKILCLLRTSETGQNDEDSSEGIGNELAFVKYFDPIPAQDSIDRALNCIKLVWSRKETGVGNTSSNSQCSYKTWFGLVQVSCIRGVVHVVRADYGISGRGITMDMDDVPWYSQQFYLNRFYHDTDNKYYDFAELQGIDEYIKYNLTR